MKRIFLAALLVLACAAPLFAISLTVTDEVIRMHRAGVSDEVILAFLKTSKDTREVTAEDVAAMQQAGLSKEVIDAVVASPKSARASEKAAEAKAEPAPEAVAAKDADRAKSDGGFCRTFDPPVTLVLPWDYWYFYPEWIWDPYWYMPKLDTKSGADTAAAHPKTTSKGRDATAPPPERLGRLRTPGFGDALIKAAKQIAPH